MNYNTVQDQVSYSQGIDNEIQLGKPLQTKSKPFSKSFHHLAQLDAVGSNTTSNVSQMDSRLAQHRRSISTKNTGLKKIPIEEPTDEYPHITRNNSDVSLFSVRSTGKSFSKFRSRATSIEKRLQPGNHFFTASSPVQSRGVSLADFCQSNHVQTELQAIKNRSEELVAEIISAIKSHQNQIEQMVRETGVQLEENNYSTLDDKIMEVIENLVGETAGLGTIEWENKFESLKKELTKLSARNDQITRSLNESQSNLQKECNEHFEVARILTSNSNPQAVVKELTNLLEAKKKTIQQLDVQRVRSERETKDLRVLLKRKEDEITLWSSKAERFVRDAKEKEPQLREAKSKLSSLTRKLESKTRENLSLVESHQRVKEEMTKSYATEISTMEAEVSELVNRTKPIDEIYGKLAKQEREIQRLNLELQASAQEIRRLTEENDREAAAAEEKVRYIQKRHEVVMAELNREHQAKMRPKEREIQLQQVKLQQLRKESDERQSIIQKLNTETELLKRKIQEQGSAMNTKEEKYKFEISQLKKRVTDLSNILNKNKNQKYISSANSTSTVQN